jgi:hypothetical protein
MGKVEPFLRGSWFVLIIACILPNVWGRMLRVTGIGTITAPDTANSGFTPPDIPTPSGASAPAPITTPSPYSTYSPSWATSYSFNWPNNSFSFDTSIIGNFSIENMGANFAVVKTARPQFPYSFN